VIVMSEIDVRVHLGVDRSKRTMERVEATAWLQATFDSVAGGLGVPTVSPSALLADEWWMMRRE
jgi:hypothetical protein